MKQIILTAIIILMASPVFADDPNDMPNPAKGGVTWCVDEVHRTFTLRIDMSSKDRWYLAQSEMFREEMVKWVARIPSYINNLKKLGAVKWMNRHSLEETEVERIR